MTRNLKMAYKSNWSSWIMESSLYVFWIYLMAHKTLIYWAKSLKPYWFTANEKYLEDKKTIINLS